MNPAPSITLDELCAAVLSGNRRGAYARAVALVGIKTGKDIRILHRKYGVPISTLYRSIVAIESELNEKKLETKITVPAPVFRPIVEVKAKESVNGFQSLPGAANMFLDD